MSSSFDIIITDQVHHRTVDMQRVMNTLAIKVLEDVTTVQ